MTLECEKKKLKLLKIEVPDRYVQENFKRIEEHAKAVCSDLKNIEAGGGDGGDTIINVNGAWTKANNSVPASTTKVIETVGLSSFHAIDYILVLSNDLESKSKKIQMTVIREGATIKSSVNGRLGSMIDIIVNDNVNAGNFELEIINNNIFDVNISYARLIL